MAGNARLKAPFPWFGGKRMVADLVWERFGDPGCYVEPFFGGGAVFLARPPSARPLKETINDIDGYVVNFWRAVKADPGEVAHYADWIPAELDLIARGNWLVRERASFTAKLRDDPEHFDPKVAGWWAWGACLAIGKNWANTERGAQPITQTKKGIYRARRPAVCAKGVLGKSSVTQYLLAVQNRIAKTMILCGDWSRCVSSYSSLFSTDRTSCAVFLDPPYQSFEGVYAGSESVSSAVRSWCIERGSDLRLRLALCGYEGEHNALEDLGWEKVSWEGRGGYSRNESEGLGRRKLERIWFSPGCEGGRQRRLF